MVANVSWAFKDAPSTVRPKDADPNAEFTIQCFLESTVSSPVSWLWPGRIPLGKLTLLVGDPGVGKSLLALDMAARITRGAPWPDAPQQRQRQGGVLLLSAEDDVADTICPRLERAGARMEWVETLWGLSGRDHYKGYQTRTWQRPLVLPDDVRAIERILIERRLDHPEVSPDSKIPWFPPIRMMVIDPLPAYFAAGIGNDNVQVRRMLQPLIELAARYQMAIVGITHLNKSISQPGQYRTMGSLAFTAAARAVWGLTHDRDDPERRLMLPIKNNLRPPSAGLAFRIRDAKVEWEIGDVAADWKEAVARRPKANGSRATAGRPPLKRDEVAHWLLGCDSLNPTKNNAKRLSIGLDRRGARK